VPLCQQLRDEFTVNVREAEVAALEAEGELFVVQAGQVQNRGVQVVDVRAVFHGVEAKFIGLADDRTGFCATAGELHCERVNVMISAHRVAVFAHWRATEFTAPDHERVFQQSARLQVLDQSGLTLVHVTADFFKIAFEILAGTAVAVPVRMTQSRYFQMLRGASML